MLAGFIATIFSTSPCTCRVDRTKYHIQIPLPPKIDPSVTMMTVEEKPDVTYSDIGGCKEQIEKMREVSNPHFTHKPCSVTPRASAALHKGSLSRVALSWHPDRLLPRWWSCRCCIRRSLYSWA